MITKLLSIIIPTYNMEKYLGRCIESLVNVPKGLLELLEIVVVNDGSKDHSLQIANSYKKKFPASVIVVDKPNGNYGSCINVALQIISGKYVKVLDADDWFDTIEFSKYLKDLIQTDADLIITNFTNVYANGKRNNIDRTLEPYQLYDVGIFKNTDFHNIEMHAVTYRTSILKDNNYKQTEGISYTDQEWILYPMQFINSVIFYPYHIYMYFIGREGQTVDSKNMVKNFTSNIKISERMVITFKQWKENELGEPRFSFLRHKVMANVSQVYKLALLSGVTDDVLFNQTVEFDKFVKTHNTYLYRSLDILIIHTLVPYHFIKHFRKVHKRPNRFIIRLVRFLKSIRR